MKRLIKIVALLCVLFAFALSACTEEPSQPVGGDGTDQSTVLPPADDKDETPAKKVISVTARKESETVKDVQVPTYDFTKLFLITVDGVEQEVLPDYIDASDVSEKPDIYAVSCTYEKKTAYITFIVEETVYALDLSRDSVELKESAVDGTDFKGFFTATRDGETEAITEEMIESDVRSEVGDYSYSVTYHGIKKTLSVHVLPDHVAEVLLTYREPEVHVGDLAAFDPTTLFSLYFDGVAEEVTMEMLDIGGLRTAQVGDTVEIVLDYDGGVIPAHGSVTVRIVADDEFILTGKDVITYPNRHVDLTSLFTIRLGDREIPVTADMIEGSVDYTKADTYTITLRYEGKSATATVEVRQGVFIEAAHGDVVTVQVGTDQQSYPFAGDFSVVVDGTRFTEIPETWIDMSSVNFAETGDYRATLTVQYNDKAPTGDGLYGDYNLQRYAKEITYHVVNAKYNLSQKGEICTVPYGANFDPSMAIELTVNGLRQTFTTNQAFAMSTMTYYEVRSASDHSVAATLDSHSPELQIVCLALFVDGVNADPIYETVSVLFETGLTVTAQDRIAFVGQTLYARDLFTAKKGNAPILVTQDMVSGKVDTFHEGTYTVTFSHENVTATAQVIVYPKELVGYYRTTLYVIPPEEEDDADDDEFGWESYALADTPAQIAATDGNTYIGGLTIREDATIRFNSVDASSVRGIDANTMEITYSLWTFILRYYDGIVVIEAVNELRSQFNNSFRPLYFFQEDLWEIRDSVVVNSGSNYVLSEDYSNVSSFNLTRIRSKEDDREIWYGLYVCLIQHMSSNFDYEQKWGEAIFDGELDKTVGAENSFEFGGQKYTFTMTDSSTGKLDKSASQSNPYSGSYSGTIDGQTARLDISSGYTLYIGGQIKVLLRSNDVMNMKRGGVMTDGSVFLYGVDTEYGTFSYRFMPNKADRTFTLVERDLCFGVYDRGDVRIFLDGYGSGCIYEDMVGHKSTGTDLSYTEKNGDITVTFLSLDPKYVFGKEARFHLATTLNLLTPDHSEGDSLSGEDFVNSFITDGAIIRRTETIFSFELGVDIMAEFYKSLTITTKDGVLGDEEKKALINVEPIDFNNSGFYQFTVTVKVGGEDVVSCFSVEVLQNQAAYAPVAGQYTTGLIHGLGLSLDLYKNARASFRASGKSYTGTYTYSADESAFTAKVYSADGSYICVKGTLIQKGLIHIVCTGAIAYEDYLTTGTFKAAGTDHYVLWWISLDEGDVYLAGTNANSVSDCKVVEVQRSGSEYTITSDEGTRRANIEWGSPTAGLTFLGDAS